MILEEMWQALRAHNLTLSKLVKLRAGQLPSGPQEILWFSLLQNKLTCRLIRWLPKKIILGKILALGKNNETKIQSSVEIA
jgi:hypothetical protein